MEHLFFLLLKNRFFFSKEIALKEKLLIP
jgi:hypothetical protein